MSGDYYGYILRGPRAVGRGDRRRVRQGGAGLADHGHVPQRAARPGSGKDEPGGCVEPRSNRQIYPDNGSVGSGLPMLPDSEMANAATTATRFEGVHAELEGNGNTQSGRDGSNNGGYWLDGRKRHLPLGPEPWDVVLLDIGTNDATDGESAATILSQLTQLLNDLKTDLPDAQILVGVEANAGGVAGAGCLGEGKEVGLGGAIRARGWPWACE